ncbi:linker for activation of T-cells family member 1-like [Anabas testudineus]|uniref:linker for activation of T-cells family member 1-like n=1 Tax=Anabas testudineus TaxID=64144 RepID=UPI000E45AC0C|nr:linker for activation of T-cells family member 1-like [Anabas testudineus]
MDVSWFVLVVSAAVFVSIVLLAVVCLDCRKEGPLVSIRETSPSDEYINPPLVNHPFHLAPDPRSARSPSTLTPAEPGSHWRHRSVTPTETESNPSYENPVLDGPDNDTEEPYVIVIPDDGGCALTNQSRASTPSIDQHDYENVPEQKVPMCADAEEDRDYLNVEPLHFHQLLAHSNTDEDSSDEDTDEDDTDDDKGNYVNELPISYGHPSA